MVKWKRPKALTMDEIRTVGFLFGLSVVAFWSITAVGLAVIHPEAPPPAPNLGVVSIVAGLVLQQAFKHNGDRREVNDDPSDPPDAGVAGEDGSSDQRVATRRGDRAADDRRRGPLHDPDQRRCRLAT